VTVRPIRLVPDPVLRQVCAPVTRFDADLKQLADDMLETMYAATGRGLAAPQVGEVLRLFVMDTEWKTGDPAPQVFVNPEIVGRSLVLVTREEGCLSIPGDLTPVARPDAVMLRWQELDCTWQEGEFEGFAAACVQHETDHLDGVLITDPERAA
jgi:peptide deformylase